MLNTALHLLRRIMPAAIALLATAAAAQPSFTKTAAQAGQVVLLGDSNIWLSGDGCDRPQGWPAWFVKELRPEGARSFARSGATWTGTPATACNPEEYTEVLGDDNVIFNQVVRLRMAVDSGVQPVPETIVIGAGTNDAWFRKRRPRVFAQTVTAAFSTPDATAARKPSEALTLAAAVRFNCEMLREAFPTARIVLLTPLQSAAVPETDIRRAAGIIEGCAERLGAYCIRMDGTDGLDCSRERMQKVYTTDGTHTSTAGAQRIGHYVARQVREILLREARDTAGGHNPDDTNEEIE
ncbi:MAG: SGNH/GDSL hydrolase family protein [Alloprevotella sp.]|nr:SGNH/GDSL hydrolase family protein [Alloprevotella sp.]